MKDDEVDVKVITCLMAQPGVDRPPAAEEPRATEAGHEVDDSLDRFGDEVDK